jgi:hypothetical protein
MALLQGIKKLFGPLLDGYHHTGTSSQGKDILKAKRASLADETFEMLMFMRGNKHHVTIFFC